ncbi:thioredoxin family protein [Cytobacillus sp. Hz8]|uniref:thioredoxin family protein n=1 Tax=Cytobacillus sp. Hz8 TaxID=3347168 RepID=UPI0035DFDA41
MSGLKQYMEKKGVSFLYLYTPLCGTCKIAGKILEVVEQLLPNEQFRKMNLNFIPEYAKEWSIESVPCLLIFQNGKILERIYAFHSVPHLYEKLQGLVKSN